MYKPECIYSLKYPFTANGLILIDTEPFHSKYSIFSLCSRELYCPIFEVTFLLKPLKIRAL